MISGAFFDCGFRALTGRPPFGWQRRLFEQHFADFGPPRCEFPPTLDLPTGLGKTSVIAIWLLALAWQAHNGGVRLPRRLVYVVDRRTVVDQATEVGANRSKQPRGP
jgi:CRISPR-associated endonuclease/helicase Cas3